MLYIVLLVVFIIMMLAWLGYGIGGRDPARPWMVGGTLAPWVCVLILGLIVFRAVDLPVPVVQQTAPYR